MRKIMKKSFLLGLVAGLFLFCVAGFADATMQKFYVQINRVSFDNGNFDYWMTHSNYIGPAGGEKYYGAVEYNSSSIPNIGNYTIGWTPYSQYSTVPVNEYQNWSFRMQNIFGYEGSGFGDPLYNQDPLLKFKNGQLVGIDCGWTNDIYGWGGPALEYLEGDKFHAWGELMSSTKVCAFDVLGSLHFIPTPVPEPAPIFLLVSGLAVLAGIRKKMS